MYTLCRWVCKHFGTAKDSQVLRRTGKRPNQTSYTTDCKAAVYVAYSKETQVRVVVMVLLNNSIVACKCVAIHFSVNVTIM